jgi:predicted nuclease of predicted toxin-antitoxin system
LTRKKLLLDENLPHKLRELLTEHDVFTVAFKGWVGMRNGDLLEAAEREGFDVLLTSDQGFPHEQNMEGRKLAVLLLPTPDWNVLRSQARLVQAATKSCSPGTLLRVSFGQDARA